MMKKTAEQLDCEIAEALSQPPPSRIKLKDRHSGGHVWLTIRDGRIVGVMGFDPSRYMGMTLEEARHHARYGGRGHSSHSTIKHDSDEARMFGRYARRMEQTKAQTLANARAEGFAAHQLGAVEEGWEAERSDTAHGGFADSSHATRRQAQVTKAPSRKRGRSVADLSHARRRGRAPRVTPYRLNLTPDELRAVEFARGRYAWPDMLSAHADEDGSVAFTESEMWQWTDDVDSDAGGRHSPFPLASGAFANKLQRFYDARV
jgi:hypothetical protein